MPVTVVFLVCPWFIYQRICNTWLLQELYSLHSVLRVPSSLLLRLNISSSLRISSFLGLSFFYATFFSQKRSK